MGDNDRAGASLPLTVALDVPAAQVLADQTAVIQDLQFVMESCRRLLAELARPESERDAVVPVAQGKGDGKLPPPPQGPVFGGGFAPGGPGGGFGGLLPCSVTAADAGIPVPST